MIGQDHGCPALLEGLLKEKEFAELISRLDYGGLPAVVSGLGDIHRAHAAAALHRITGRAVLLLCADEIEAGRYAGDLAAFAQAPVLRLPGREFTFYNAEGVSRQMEHRRIAVLYAMAEQKAPLIVATVPALMQRTMPGELFLESAETLKLGDSRDLSLLAEKLVRLGYKRCDQVEGTGQFALRGGILDFFSPAHERPVRCEFWGDEVDSMGFFDIYTQRRLENIDSAVILPSAETLASLHESGEEGLADDLSKLLKKARGRKTAAHGLAENIESDIEKLKTGRLTAADRYMELIYGGFASALDYVSPETVIFMCESPRLADRAEKWDWQMREDIKSLMEGGHLEGSLAKFSDTWDETVSRLSGFPLIMADSFTTSSAPVPPRAVLNLMAKRLPSYGGSLETAVGDVGHYVKSGYGTVVLCANERRAGILMELLGKEGIAAALDYGLETLPEGGRCSIAVGGLSAGLEYPSSKLAVITEGQITEPVVRGRVKKKTRTNRQKVASFTDLSPGDLVVHEHHGIGRFVGIFQIPIDGVEKDYIKIAYSGTDSLYVPATQLDMVAKYIGGGEDKPVRLSKMGGGDWQKTKSRAKGAVKEMAKELLALYAERQRRSGYAFSPDSSWQAEFEDGFGYAETEDQLRSITEIKADMERTVPMDRLLCGDVGYGKTEVALRAAMKCVLDGKQAAILVPTTVLAQQHYSTSVNRFANYPVKIEVLSRFKTSAQIKKAIKGIKAGTVDIVIGTHRLIQKDVEFKDLGLLIIDEEQRFGVAHKERLKEISRCVDALALSATPIPRTLNMAFSGIRDMSTIEEPPQDRQPVQTYVLEHDWGIIADAIRREVGRGGQVYYLHNRVETIERTAMRLSGLLEGISVAVAHGKMDEESLGNVMEMMAEGRVSVLVCTTIIETGIDIPNVNTLIIEDADKLGLSQLHQIRGRVGRSNRRAYAYLTFRQGKVLTDVASRRLSAIREFAEFNSGFKIAMRDLEIRGAGNLLGAEQSGHMLSVGYDMYLKLLEEAVLEEKGETAIQRADCSADLTVSANIPERYIPSGEQRMDLYRRIAQIRTEEDADDITDELIDRYGEPPKSVNTLIYVALLRARAAEAGISEITQKSGRLHMKLAEFNMEKISALYGRAEYKSRVKIEAGNSPAISLKLQSSKSVVDEAMKFVEDYAGAVADAT